MRRPFIVVVIVALLSPAAASAKTRFLWGVATAGFQGDMGPGAPNDPNSDWWAWVRDPDNIKSDRVSGDLPENGPAQWTHYKQDVALAHTKLHANAYRLSIEWSRIFPRTTAGATSPEALDALADQSALAHYRAVLTAIRKAGMTPFVTLDHFTLPLWIHDPIATRAAFANVGPDDPPPSGMSASGWLDPATTAEFAKYAGYVAAKLGDVVDYWTPLNEPNVVAAQGYLNVPGIFAEWFPPGVFNYSAVIDVTINEAHANAAAYDAIKRADPTSKVGLVQHMIAWQPAKRADKTATKHADYLFNRLFLDAAVKGDYDVNANGVIDAGEHHPELARKADFVGVNYYRPAKVTALPQPLSKHIPLYDFIPKVEFSKKECAGLCSDLGWKIDPIGFEKVLLEAAGYKLPIYVTENGIAVADDRRRADFLPAVLEQVLDAIHDGADVRGYFHWSSHDNFEWAHGYSMRFGLVAVDLATQERTVKPSGRLYADIAAGNALPEGD